MTADSSGARTAELWYKPWGEARGAFGATPTTYRFTGQREDASTRLYFFNARYYDAALGRFIQADTIVPQPGDPQSLNRYSYSHENPLRYIDPSGHAPNLPNCTGTPDCVIEPWWVTTPGMQTVQAERDRAAVVALEVDAAILVAPSVTDKLGQLLLRLIAPACADGDCTNEVRGAGQVVQGATQASQSVWRMNPLRRGAEIEARLGGRSPSLPYNFPGIDRFENGVATSIKSIDLGAETYRDIGSLTSKVQGYVNDLANWQGSQWPSSPILSTQISGRELLLAIPQGATADQLAALQALQQWAQGVNVTLTTVVVP